MDGGRGQGTVNFAPALNAWGAVDDVALPLGTGTDLEAGKGLESGFGTPIAAGLGVNGVDETWTRAAGTRRFVLSLAAFGRAARPEALEGAFGGGFGGKLGLRGGWRAGGRDDGVGRLEAVRGTGRGAAATATVHAGTASALIFNFVVTV